MTLLADLDTVAAEHGWKGEPIVMLGAADARRYHHLALPGATIEACEWNRRYGFHTRLLVCGRERGTYNDHADVISLFADLDLIQPRCRIPSCPRPSKTEDRCCPMHEEAPDAGDEEAQKRGWRQRNRDRVESQEDR